MSDFEDRANERVADIEEWTTANAEAIDVLTRVRAYVDDPGNWSALDGRRQVLLDMLDGKR